MGLVTRKKVATIQKHAKTYLGRKSAFMYTHGYNKVMRSLIGNYPKMENKNEKYKRATVFRKAIIQSMKVPKHNNFSIIRGLSGPNANIVRKHIANGTPYNRNAFSSFSKYPNVAMKFTNSNASGKNKILIAIPNARIPSINYGGRNSYRSLYNEKEILLPPGRFTFNKSKVITHGPYTLYQANFKPKNINNINKNTKMLEASGEKKFPVKTTKTLHNNNGLNMNMMWKTRHIRSRAHKMGVTDVTKLRNIMKMSPKSNIPIRVMNHYSKKYGTFDDKKWYNILVKFIADYQHLNPNGLSNLTFDMNKKMVSKKLLHEIIIYLWNKLSPKQKTLFKIRSGIPIIF